MSDSTGKTREPDLGAFQRRLDELEAENRRLAARVEGIGEGTTVAAARGPAPRAEDLDVAATEDGALGRRGVLKRFGTVAAAGVGMAALGGVMRPEPALAEINDPLHIGADNNAGNNNMTTLRMATAGDEENPAVLTLEQDAVGGVLRLVTNGDIVAPLEIEPGGNSIPPIGPDGALATRRSGGITDLYFYHVGADDKDDPDLEVGRVYTSQWANFLTYLSEPIRVLDTRESGTHPEGSAGKIVGNYTIDVSDHVPDNTIAVFGTLTAAAPDDNGFLALWESGDHPGTSNLNFTTGTNIATLATTRVTADRTFRLRAHRLSHVIFDISAIIVPE